MINAIITATQHFANRFQARVAAEDFALNDELIHEIVNIVMQDLKYHYAIDHDIPDDSPALPHPLIDTLGIDDEVSDYTTVLYDIVMPAQAPTDDYYLYIRNLINDALHELAGAAAN